MTLYLVLLLLSLLGLIIIFLRRLRLTYLDHFFQKHLEKQEQALTEESPPDMDSTEAAVRAVDPGTSTRRFKEAMAFLKAGHLGEAEVALVDVVTWDPTHKEAHHELGLLYLKQGQFPEAEVYFSKLVNIKKDPVYFSNLGAALYRQQRLIEAAEAYENAIALDNRRANRLLSLAQVYHELGEDEAALKYFEMASKKKPKDIDLKWLLADYYEKLKRYPEALEKLLAIESMDPYNDVIKERIKSVRSHLDGPQNI